MGIGVALDVPDEDDVVATIVPVLVAALEMSSGALSTGAPHSGIIWSISANLLSCVRANLFDRSI